MLISDKVVLVIFFTYLVVSNDEYSIDGRHGGFVRGSEKHFTPSLPKGLQSHPRHIYQLYYS